MVKESPLGKPTSYVETYSPDLLFPIPRTLARDKLGIFKTFSFHGGEIWNAYELSWLGPKGKPVIGAAEFYFPCDTPNIIESKSFKLYLNSFNQTAFSSFDEVKDTLERDLKNAVQGDATVSLFRPEELAFISNNDLSEICLDDLDIEIDQYSVNPSFLKIGSPIVQEKLSSYLLKSNCLATGQPDWGSLHIHYAGPKIDHEGLLKYIISFRRHSGFAEHCVEQIYYDLLTHCQPEKLTVYARYTRRGGLDINPWRSNFETNISNKRHHRQ